jgi:hypothetical protein
MSTGSQHVHWGNNLAIQLGLLPLLALILFGLFSFILPLHPSSVWTIPALVASGGAVALLVAWPFSQPVRALLLDALAATLAIASAVPGFAVTMLIAYGVALHVAENRSSTQSLIFELTNPMVLRQVLQFALVPVAPGLLGLWLAKRRATTRTSRAAVAARFAILSLALSAFLGCVIIVGAAYRRIVWP